MYPAFNSRFTPMTVCVRVCRHSLYLHVRIIPLYHHRPTMRWRQIFSQSSSASVASLTVFAMCCRSDVRLYCAVFCPESAEATFSSRFDFEVRSLNFSDFEFTKLNLNRMAGLHERRRTCCTLSETLSDVFCVCFVRSCIWVALCTLWVKRIFWATCAIKISFLSRTNLTA